VPKRFTRVLVEGLADLPPNAGSMLESIVPDLNCRDDIGKLIGRRPKFGGGQV
jgi:hypothetical protein